jgi:hypothetical protein
MELRLERGAELTIRDSVMVMDGLTAAICHLQCEGYRGIIIQNSTLELGKFVGGDKTVPLRLEKATIRGMNGSLSQFDAGSFGSSKGLEASHSRIVDAVMLEFDLASSPINVTLQANSVRLVPSSSISTSSLHVRAETLGFSSGIDYQPVAPSRVDPHFVQAEVDSIFLDFPVARFEWQDGAGLRGLNQPRPLIYFDEAWVHSKAGSEWIWTSCQWECSAIAFFDEEPGCGPPGMAAVKDVGTRGRGHWAGANWTAGMGPRGIVYSRFIMHTEKGDVVVQANFTVDSPDSLVIPVLDRVCVGTELATVTELDLRLRMDDSHQFCVKASPMVEEIHLTPAHRFPAVGDCPVFLPPLETP